MPGRYSRLYSAPLSRNRNPRLTLSGWFWFLFLVTEDRHESILWTTCRSSSAFRGTAPLPPLISRMNLKRLWSMSKGACGTGGPPDSWNRNLAQTTSLQSRHIPRARRKAQSYKSCSWAWARKRWSSANHWKNKKRETGRGNGRRVSPEPAPPRLQDKSAAAGASLR